MALFYTLQIWKPRAMCSLGGFITMFWPELRMISEVHLKKKKIQSELMIDLLYSPLQL